MYYLGIDLGGTNIAAGIVDDNFRIIKKGKVPTHVNRSPELIVKDMGSLCRSLTEECGISSDEIAYVGIAAPGSINPDSGVIEYANNLPFMKFPISDILKKYFPVKKYILKTMQMQQLSVNL